MSYVCDTILKFSILENKNNVMEQVNSFFDDGDYFVMLDSEALPAEARHWYGGSKAFQTPIAIGAFNYLDLPRLKEHLRNKVNWKYPKEVQLIYCNEDDFGFQIWEPHAGKEFQ